MPTSDIDSLFVFNMVSVFVFSGMVVCYASYLYRSKEGRNDSYTLFTVLACMVSLICKLFMFVNTSLVRISLSVAMLYIFKDLSLKTLIYQYFFFEVPYYVYMIVGYTLLFSW